MVVKVIFYDVLFEYNHTPEKIEFVSYFDNNTTLQELFDNAGYPCADLSDYYYLSGAFSFNSSYLPFIINSSGGIDWDISYQDAKVVDFISTHRIENNEIVSKIGYPQAGGPGFKDLIDIWNLIYPILDQAGTVVVVGSIIKNVGKWVYTLFGKKDIPPQSQFDLIFSRENWNHFDLAKLIDIDPDEAKQLLKLFRYRYDKHVLMYVQTESSLEIREQLSKINLSDI